MLRLKVVTSVVCVVTLVACSGRQSSGGSSKRASPSTGASAGKGSSASPGVAHRRGGSARVGVWGEPNPDGSTLGAAAVRSLVLPQLFVAGPDGRWSASLVVPGTDRTAADNRSATVRLRSGAVWSDGSPITADDLRRSADSRFVAGVDGPAAGALTLRFTQALPGWRRLWSGTAVVTPPAPGIWGGPFVLAGYIPGLEAVLRANERWYAGRPNLDEIHLVLVPDPITARQLLAEGRLDVIMPPAATVRIRQLASMAQISVAEGKPGGWWVGLLLRPGGLSRDQRVAVIASVDRAAFVTTLLQGEATVLDTLGPSSTGPVASGAGPGTWTAVGPGDTGALRGVTVDLVGELEEPMTATLERSMQKRARFGGGRLELRNAEADRVERWVAEGSYQASLLLQFDGPEPCWTCRWAAVDEPLARAADAGDEAAVRALEGKLRDEAIVLPLWRPTPVVAWRVGLGGVRANGFALSGAWNAWEWWRDR